MSEDRRMDIEQLIDRQSREQIARTRQIILEHGRPDVLAEFDKNMRDVQLGITQARGTWHALSEVQRKVLDTLAQVPLSLLWDTIYGYRAPKPVKVCQSRSLRSLMARGLADHESDFPRFRITERGRFVLKHGPAPADITTSGATKE